jgi:COP9 signalosome complex subunit 5
LLWKKYWIKTLSSSPLLKNKFYTDDQIKDLTTKIESVENEISKVSRGFIMHEEVKGEKKKKEDSALSKINKDSSKITMEVLRGMMINLIKNSIFNVNLKDTK